MNHPKLEWFLTVVECGSISRAAERLFASQQSVSAYVKRLEAFYQLTLFDRSDGFSLTAQGNLLYQYAKQVVARERSLIEKFEMIRNDEGGRIRFGISLARAQALLPQLIPRYRESYPNVQVVPVEASTAILTQQLAARRIDLFFGKDFDAPAHIRKDILLYENLYAIASDRMLFDFYGDAARTVISGFSGGVTLRELSELPFVTVDSSGKVDRPIEAYCMKRDIRLNSVVQVPNTPLLIDLCRSHMGIGLCLEAFLPQILPYSHLEGSSHLNVFPIKDSIADWKVILAYYPGDNELPYFTSFKDIIRNLVCKDL